MTRFVLAAAGLLGAATLAGAGPADLFEEKVKDFGVTPRGPVLVHYFRFTNTTNQTITLGQPRVSCGCVSAAVTKNQVAPGETAAVIAYMDTRRIPQPYVTKSVTVYAPMFTGASAEEATFRVQAVARDDLMMSPNTLAFGTVRKGQGGKVSAKVTLTSDPNWQVTKSTSTGGNVHVEHKLDSRNGSVVTYEVTATLDKDCPVGNWTSDIFLETSNQGVTKLRVPVTVNVVAPVAVSPEAVQFGDVAVGKPAEKRVVVQGAEPFKILQVKGTDEQVAVKVDSEEAKPVHVVTVSFKPATAGAFKRDVEIVTDSQEAPKVVVPVTAKVNGQ
jgi:hypothetical protein